MYILKSLQHDFKCSILLLKKKMMKKGQTDRKKNFSHKSMARYKKNQSDGIESIYYPGNGSLYDGKQEIKPNKTKQKNKLILI